MNVLRSRGPRLINLIRLTAIACATACGSSSAPTKPEAGSPPDATDAAAEPDAPPLTCPATCDDNNPCTDDSCDAFTFQCVHIPKEENSPCQGTPCATKSVCQGGLCLDGPRKVCSKPNDPCLVAGVCNSTTGVCSTDPAPNGTSCDDGLKCTYSKQCLDGKCTGTPIVCPGGKLCDPATGSCPGDAGFPDSVAGWTFDNAGWPSNGSGLVRSTDGQLFLAGRYAVQLDLGLGPVKPTPLAAGDFDLFLARLDPATLKASWVTTFPGPQAQNLASFAVDGAGHIALIGPLQGAITVAGKKLTAAYPGDQYIVAARSTDGAGLWARRINLQSETQLTGRPIGLQGIAGDPLSSTFLICGNVDCSSAPMLGDAGPDPNPAKDLAPSLVCQGGSDSVFALLDDSDGGADGGGTGGKGATLWADQVGGSNDDYCSNVAIDNAGHAFIIGTYKFGSELTFGQLPPLPVIDQAIGSPTWMYLAKLDLQTAAQSSESKPWIWATSIGTDKQALSPVTMIAVDGDVLIAGKLVSGPQTVLGTALTSPYFVARFDGGSGKPKWVKEIGPGCGVTIASLAAANGRIVVSGTYVTACTFGGVPFAPPSPRGNAFVAQIDGSSGSSIFAQGFANAGNTSTVLGTVGLPGDSPLDPNGTLSLFSYSSEIDLGDAVGVLSSTSVSASCLAALAP